VSFAKETKIKAVRKPYRCDGCHKRLAVGEPATRWAGMTEGEFGTAIYHPDCREAEVDLNNDILGWQWGDDWLPLYEIDREDWLWLTGAYPAVAARMRITTEGATGNMRSGVSDEGPGMPPSPPLPLPPAGEG
jgi:hypothetical protein